MNNLPIDIIRNIYEYDSTFKIEFNKVLRQLRCYCLIYRCHLCYLKWNNCSCYCKVCKTYLKFCHQIYFDENSTYEDELNNVIALN